MTIKGEKYKNTPTHEDIARWLDPDERVISHDTVRDMIGVAENLVFLNVIALFLVS